MSQEDESKGLRFSSLALIAAFTVGVVIGASHFSTTHTKTEVKWKEPDARTTIYTIESVETDALMPQENESMPILRNDVEVNYLDAPEMFKGGSIMIKNSIDQLERYGADHISVDSIKYKAEIYDNGRKIDEYDQTCHIWQEYEGDYIDSNQITDAYNMCFDIEVQR